MGAFFPGRVRGALLRYRETQAQRNSLSVQGESATVRMPIEHVQYRRLTFLPQSFCAALPPVASPRTIDRAGTER